MTEWIESNGEQLALILRSGFQEPGIHFFTPQSLSQQLGYMRHPAGHVIEPHVHNPIQREVQYTQEVLFLRRGSLRVDFYAKNGSYCESRVINSGDVLLLISGGHGFQALEEIEMIEVKQGPYTGLADKRRITSVCAGDVRVVEEK